MKTFFPFLLILPLVAACASGPSKGQLDDEVRRLCAIDGGIKVYETVRLSAKRFDRNGRIHIRAKWLAKAQDDYYYESSTLYIERGNPELRQDHYKIYRRSDGKLLGESVSYSRVGGDMPGPWHQSSFMCPENSDLARHVFIQSNEE